MRSLLFLLLAFVVLPDSGADRITPELNEVLQEKCGRKSYQRKVINGQSTVFGDHPWAASIYVKSRNNDIFVGPGTIFSPRHILGFNMVRSHNDTLMILKDSLRSLGTCEGSHLILPKEANKMFDVDYEYMKPLNSTRHFVNSITQIMVVNGCKTLSNANLLILELNENIKFGRFRRVSCLSNSPSHWDEMDYFDMFGVNRSGILVTGKFEPLDCSARYPFSCATPLDKNQGLCTGDFGGSAVVPVNEKYTVVGMYSKGNVQCSSDPTEIQEYKFINIGYFRKSICDLTGVCAPAPPEEPVDPKEDPRAQETTTAPRTSTAIGEPIYATEDSDIRETTTTAPRTSTDIGEPIYATEESDTRETTTTAPRTSTDIGVPIYATEDSDPRDTTTSPRNYTAIGAPIYIPTEDPTTTESYATENSDTRDITTTRSQEGSSSEEETLEPVYRTTQSPYHVGEIVAETFDKLKINGSCSGDNKDHSGHVKNIHIHIHLNK